MSDTPVRRYGVRRMDLHWWGDGCEGIVMSGRPNDRNQLRKVVLASDFDQLSRECEQLRADARRYAQVWVHGFPVRNQTGNRDKRWVAFCDGLVFYGPTPSFAIDAAIGELPPETKETP